MGEYDIEIEKLSAQVVAYEAETIRTRITGSSV